MLVTRASAHGDAETLDRLRGAISERGLTVFAQFDHAAAAREVEMDLAAEIVVVFGNARAGTPLMQEDPRIGIELPLRVVLWNRDGTTMLGYRDPRELAHEYAVPEHASTLQAMADLLHALVEQAAA